VGINIVSKVPGRTSLGQDDDDDDDDDDDNDDNNNKNNHRRRFDYFGYV
jgi:hypothetical protein